MIVAIPTHHRSESWTTYALLRKKVGYTGKVELWLSDVSDAEKYRVQVHASDSIVVMDGAKLHEKLNAIHMHYHVGERVLVVEDDLTSYAKKAGKKVAACDVDLIHDAEDAFAKCEALGVHLWGVSSHSNAFYMGDGFATGCRFIVAYMFGFVSTRDPWLRVTSDWKHDFERSLLYYASDRSVVRREDRCVITKPPAKVPGGLQADYQQCDRLKQEALAIQRLERKFCPLARVRSAKKTGIGSLLLRDPEAGRYNWRAHFEENWKYL